MELPGPLEVIERDLAPMHTWVREVRAKLAGWQRPISARASFDPVRVEAELYDALYGSRSGSVDNIVPVSSEEPGVEGRGLRHAA
jgi:hypothetical protein